MPTIRLPPLLALLAAVCAAAPARAETSPYSIGVAQSVTRDSNLLRIQDGQPTPEGRSRSDTVSSTSLVGGIDQPIGRQRLHGSATVSATRYSENDDFDGTTYAADLGLDWETVHRLSGVLKAATRRTLRQDIRNAANGTLSEANYENDRRLDFLARLGVVTPLTFELGAGARRLSYSAQAMDFRDYRDAYALAALKWRPGGSTTFGIGLRRTDIEYPNLLAGLAVGPSDERSRDAVDLTVRWTPTGSSSLDARLTRSRTRHEVLDYRDFDATSGELAWRHDPGGRTRLDLRLARDEGQDADVVTSVNSRTTDSLRLRLDHQLSGKLVLNAHALAYRRSLEGTVFGTRVADGEDRGSRLGLGIRWQALRSLTLACDASRERRGANDNPGLSGPYRATVYGCNAQFVLQ